jgi:glutamate racemase
MVKIVVFDSGFGSLSIIKQIRKKMKAEIIYFADQKNFPYGMKKTIHLKKIINNTIKFLKTNFKPDLIIVGSNTPSILLGNYKSSKIIGVYPPLCEASKTTQSGTIAILTTHNVVHSKALSTLIKKNISKKIKLIKINASPLVELVETGKFIYKKKYCEKRIKNLLTKIFLENQVDVVTLSSTHLPFLLPYFQKLFPRIHFLDPAETIVQKIGKYYKTNDTKCSFTIYSSGKISKFQDLLSQIGIKRKVKYLRIH